MSVEEMLKGLRGASLTKAARSLEVDPFEIIRLLVAMDDDQAPMWFFDARIRAISAFAGIEWWWTDPADAVSDPNPRRVLVRTTARNLAGRAVGSASTRIDNLWRGLEPDQRQVVEQTVALFIENGHLIARPDLVGTVVSVSPTGLDPLRKIGEGAFPPALVALCEP